MSTPKLKILISGAGIAGNCLAFWLSKSRLAASITVLERSPVPRVSGQSIDIHGPAIEIVKKMGLDDAIRARHTTENGCVIVNSSGKPFARFDHGTFTAEYELLRADLAGIFSEATEKLADVHHKYGDFVTSLDQTEKNVNVTFNGGSKDTFDLVVAADGSTSKTRSMILDESITKDSFYFLGMYSAFFSIPSKPTDPKLWQWYNTPKGLNMMLRPHRNPTTTGAYMSIITPAREQRDEVVEEAMNKGPEETKRMLRKYFENAGWQAERMLDGMDQADDFYMSRSAQIRLSKWTNGRACVLGDAAHATMGVGTTLAIQSAYMLAGELSKIKSSEDIPEALERFEQVYRPMFAKSEDIPAFFPQAAFPQTSWGLRLRDALLWFASKSQLYRLFRAGSELEVTLPEYDWQGVRAR